MEQEVPRCRVSCGFAEFLKLTPPEASSFSAYWYPNGAEISRYDLKQVRYGEVHSGDAVLIFVTESMNPALQVKAHQARPSA